MGSKKQDAAPLRRRSEESKRDAVRLVTEEDYSVAAAAGWVCLAVVMDLFSRKIVGWTIAASLGTELIADALRKAIELRRPAGQQLPRRSDRGCQCTSDAHQHLLRTLGSECSTSRTGNCHDNAARERFFGSLKHEWTKHESFDNLEDARLSVFRYIETFCHPERLHQTLGYQAPNPFEAGHAPAQAA